MTTVPMPDVRLAGFFYWSATLAAKITLMNGCLPKMDALRSSSAGCQSVNRLRILHKIYRSLEKKTNPKMPQDHQSTSIQKYVDTYFRLHTSDFLFFIQMCIYRYVHRRTWVNIYMHTTIGKRTTYIHIYTQILRYIHRSIQLIHHDMH